MQESQLTQLLLDQKKDLVWMINNKYELIYANKSYFCFMKDNVGVEKKLTESAFVETFGKEDIEKWKANYNRAIKGEYFELEEHFYNSQNNTTEYNQITFNPIFGDNKEVVAVACQSRDISRIVKQKSELNQLVDSSLDVFCTVNEKDMFVFVSAAAANLWGYTPEELVGKPYMNLVLEEDVQKTKEIATLVQSGKNIKSFANRYKKKDGSIAYNLWSTRWDKTSKLLYCVARDGKEIIEQDEINQQSEQRFKALVQEGSDLIAILNLQGNYTYVSPTSKVILGIDAEEFIGKSPFEYIHNEDAERVIFSLKEITTEKKVTIEPFRFRNNKKEWRWIETVLTNMLDNPAINGIVANSRDVTDKINTLKQLEANELFNRTILESSPDCFKILDTEGRVQYMNLNGLCLMEIDDFSTIKNKNWCSLWNTENEALVKASFNKALKGEIAKFTAFCTTAKGTPKWWDVIVSPVGKAGETVQQVISVSRDVTEQKKEEQRLKLLESVITNTKDAVLITEAEPFDEPGNRIIYVNEAFTKMTGYSPEEVIGKTPRILQGPNSDKEKLAEIGRKMRRWEACELTIINYKKNGEEFWINFSLTPVADETGWYTHWISIERDVTEQKIKELEKDLIAQISLNFSATNDFAKAGLELCKTISIFGNFDLVEVWATNIEKEKIQLYGHYLASANDESFYDDNLNYREFKKAEGLPGNVWAKQQQQLWDNISENNDFIRKDSAKKIDLKALLGIPLIFNNDLVGVLIIGTKNKAEYLNKYTKIFHILEKYIGSEINRKKLERDLNHLYEAIPDIICLVDFQGRFLKMNKAGSQLLGYTEEEIVNNTCEKFVHPDDKNISTNEILRLKNGATTFKFENRYITKSGETIWLSWIGNSRLNEGVIYASAKNITEEKKLRELNQLANTLAKIGSWELDLVNDKLYWSDMVHQLHETNPKTYIPDAKNIISFYRKDFHTKVQSSIENCITTGEPFDFEAIIVTANKKEKWIRLIGNVDIVAGEPTRIYGSMQDINERKEAALALEKNLKSLENYKFSLDQSAIIAFTDEKGLITSVNDNFCDISKYNREELIGKTHQLVNSKHHSKEFFKDLWKTISSGKVWRGEIKNKAKDGSYYWVFTTIVPFLDKKNKPFQYLANRFDITSRKNSEIKLVESENRFRTILGAEPECIKLLGANNELLMMNPAGLAMIEADKEENVVGKSVLGFILPEHRTAFSNLTKKVFKGKSGTLVFEIAGLKGTRRWMETNAVPLKNEQGDIVSLLAVTRDITERKAAQEKLADSELMYRLLSLELQLKQQHLSNAQEVAKIGSWETNVTNLKVTWSDETHRIFGTDIKTFEPSHTKFLEFIHPLDKDNVDKAFIESISNKTQTQCEIEHRIITTSGEVKDVLERWKINYNNTGEPILVVGICQDITERKKAEVELVLLNKSLNEQAEELKRSNEELEQFAFVASHDLQEPLRMIAGFMDLLERKYGNLLDEKGRQYIHYATDGAKRMKQIILDLLDYSRASKPTEGIEEVNLNDILSEFKQLRRKLISENSATIIANNLPTLNTYKASITQILHCLLDNALKYSVKEITPTVEINAKEKEKTWEFSIKDNGIGIGPEFHEKIFVIFQRLHNKDEYAGTGVGLSIAKKHVEFLGGKIWLESKPGQGSTFYFDIPKS